MLKFLIESGQFKGDVAELFMIVIKLGESIEELNYVIDDGNNFDSIPNGYLDIVKYIVEKHGVEITECSAINAVIDRYLHIIKYVVEQCGYDPYENNDSVTIPAEHDVLIEILSYFINESEHNFKEWELNLFFEREFLSSCVINSVDRVIFLMEKYNCNIHMLKNKRPPEYDYKIFKNKKFINYLLTKPLDLYELHYKLRYKFKKKFDLMIKDGLCDFIINDLSNIVCKYI
jgi:hypothetical protein